MRNEQVAGFGERVEALCSPGAQEGRQSHLAVGSLFGSSAAADLAADHQMSQTPFRSVVLRRHVWMRYKDEQPLDEPLYTPAELDLGRRIVVGEGATQREQLLLQHQLAVRHHPLVAGRRLTACFSIRLSPVIELAHRPGPPDQARVLRV